MAAHGFSTDELARMQELSNTWEPEATVCFCPIICKYQDIDVFP
jgi:hypothetical protein